MTEQPAPEYTSYQMSVPGTWNKLFENRPVTVYGSRPGHAPEVVARGACRLRHMGGEPQDVRVAGFRPHWDWAKLNTGMSPGEWTTEAIPTATSQT